MTTTPALRVLADAFERVPALVEAAVRGLGPDQLAYRAGPDANSIAWLVWHLSRGEDLQVSAVAGVEQVYEGDGFADRFDLPFGLSDMGYGHTSADVAAVVVDDPQLLIDYYAAVAGATQHCLDTLSDEDLDRIVDRGWDPPVTLGVRLVSVVSDDLQHAGQANFLRGVLPG